MITDNMLCSQYSCRQQELDALREYNLSDKETGLLFALNKQTEEPLKKLV